MLRPTIEHSQKYKDQKLTEAEELLINPVSFGYDPNADQIGQA